MRIKKIDIALCALCMVLFKPYIITKELQQAFKIIMLLYVIIFIIKNVPKKNFNNIVSLLGICIVISSLYSYLFLNISIEHVFNGLLHAICLYVTYILP